ncbi:EAL domain-containing protein [Sphingomonas swuensis]|uniref:EAL domain-containing protein n=1 Tax=Sphingomonas swuensis TaxID=977800 RepID=A0ABP7SXH3_9SPHN
MAEGQGRTPAGQGSAREAPIDLATLCFLNPPQNRVQERVRQGQIDALVRMIPMTILVNVAAAIVLAISLWSHLPNLQVLLWSGLITGVSAARLIRFARLRRNPEYARAKPPTIRTIMWPIGGLTLLWMLPAFLWFDHVSPAAQVALILILFGMASGASVTMSTVPPAALLFVAMVAISSLIAMLKLEQSSALFLTPIYTGLLTYAILWNVRHFAGHLAATLELEEKGELINLLREFDASGSEWLWELAPNLTVAHLSDGLAAAIGERPQDLIGRPIIDLLDPDHSVSAVSAGMRNILDSLRSSRSFRDLAIPAKGGRAWWLLSGKPQFDAAGRLTCWRGVGSDITLSRLTGHDSITAARHDPMTGLANRLLVRELLEEALIRGRPMGGGCALMLVDLDRFKLVNDTLGHEVGDELLCEVARRLERIAPAHQVGRLGGDEFALVLTGATDRETLSNLAEAVIVVLSAPYRISGAELNIGATIGIAIAPLDGITQEGLTRSADLALYSAKKAGRGSFLFFEGAMAEEAAANRALESDLRSALKLGELSLAYQPIVHARSHEVIAREALLRWTHPVRGEVAPDLFVPVIEDAGLIGQVGNWVLREACREAAGWVDGARVAVNVSSAQLAAGPALVGHVIHALAASGLEARRLELEVTESIFLAGDATTRTTLDQLRAVGVRLVLDDFGMGYSSYACLTNGEFNTLKIDRSFTVAAAAPGRPAERAIVESILTLARGLDLDVTAEGIETGEQAALMVALGCGQLQGFLFGRPEIPFDAHTAVEPPFGTIPKRRPTIRAA